MSSRPHLCVAGCEAALLALALAGCTNRDGAAPVDAGVEDATTMDSAPLDAASSLPDAEGTSDGAPPFPAAPLGTLSRWIVDSFGRRFKLASVNWYGAESPDHVVAGLDIAALPTIAREIRALGFNSVRLPWSNELYELDPTVDPARLTANPGLVGMDALGILDVVIDALAHEGLLVVLDNHRSDADACCDVQHGDGLWYTSEYPEVSYFDDWVGMVQRYFDEPAVVGVDLRNEPRPMLVPGAPASCTDCDADAGCGCIVPVWGGGDPATDWHAEAERVGNAVLAVNPNLLVIVEGVDYSLDLTGVAALPVVLDVPDRVVYSPHDYASSHAAYASYAEMQTNLGDQWGYILTQGKAYTAPIWVGEFGTSHASPSDVSAASGQGFWFQSLRQYLAAADIDWAYWPLDGTEASGYGRTLGAEEPYGVLDVKWTAPALPALTQALRALEPATQGPP
jgi:endoglucanase